MEREPDLAAPVAEGLPHVGAEVVWAVRHEMARTVEDVLCRRTRALFLNTRAARGGSARGIADAQELGYDADWKAATAHGFEQVASHFSVEADASGGTIPERNSIERRLITSENPHQANLASLAGAHRRRRGALPAPRHLPAGWNANAEAPGLEDLAFRFVSIRSQIPLTDCGRLPQPFRHQARPLATVRRHGGRWPHRPGFTGHGRATFHARTRPPARVRFRTLTYESARHAHSPVVRPRNSRGLRFKGLAHSVLSSTSSRPVNDVLSAVVRMAISLRARLALRHCRVRTKGRHAAPWWIGRDAVCVRHGRVAAPRAAAIPKRGRTGPRRQPRPATVTSTPADCGLGYRPGRLRVAGARYAGAKSRRSRRIPGASIA
jgi:hypothetical protein